MLLLVVQGSLLYVSIAALAITAILGVIIWRKGGVRNGFALTIAHGLAAASSLMLLLFFATDHISPLPKLAFAFGALAAVFGVRLLYNDLKKSRPHSRPAVWIHALLGIGCIGLLIWFAIQQ